MSEAPDDEVLAETRQQGAVLISADTDFGELSAHSNAGEPSVILLRRQEGRRASEVAGLILANLDAVADDLAVGGFVVLDQGKRGIEAVLNVPI